MLPTWKSEVKGKDEVRMRMKNIQNSEYIVCKISRILPLFFWACFKLHTHTYTLFYTLLVHRLVADNGRRAQLTPIYPWAADPTTTIYHGVALTQVNPHIYDNEKG